MVQRLIKASDILKKKGIEVKRFDTPAFHEVVYNFFMTHEAKASILVVPKRFIEMENPPEGDFIDYLDETIWERKADDPDDPFDFINYKIMEKKGMIRPILFINEPYAGNAVGELRELGGFVVKSRTRNKKKEYIVSLPV